jgi:hypothetical protein
MRPFAGLTRNQILNEVRAMEKLCTTAHQNIVEVFRHGRLREHSTFFYRYGALRYEYG